MHSYCPFIKCTLEVFKLNSWAYCQPCTLCRVVVPPHVVKGGKINWGQLVWPINTMKYQFVPSVMETFFPKMPICRPKYWLFKVTQLIQAANPLSLNELETNNDSICTKSFQPWCLLLFCFFYWNRNRLWVVFSVLMRSGFTSSSVWVELCYWQTLELMRRVL